MVVSTNSSANINEFAEFMKRTDEELNLEVKSQGEAYFASHSGNKLETDVCSAMKKIAEGTSFEGTIELVSGARFPDIVAARYYGVEVKSTVRNQWTSIGSSILESTRIEDVERIFLTFGKLGSPVEFLSRPYEECMSEIAVTHYPRYRIDMKLGSGQTIFDKLQIPYDDFRKLPNPVEPVAKYYRGKLKEGENLWWAGDSTDENGVYLPPSVKFWSSLETEGKNDLTAHGFAYFPEVISGNYNRYSLWLVTEKGVVCPNVRDQFSSGGTKDIMVSDGTNINVSAVINNVEELKASIKDAIINTEKDLLANYWEQPIKEERIKQWCEIAAEKAGKKVKGRYGEKAVDLRDILEGIML